MKATAMVLAQENNQHKGDDQVGNSKQPATTTAPPSTVADDDIEDDGPGEMNDPAFVEECEQLFSGSRVAKKSGGLLIFGTVTSCRWNMHKGRYWYIYTMLVLMKIFLLWN